MRIDDSASPLARIRGFPAVENPSARILILGSMPGEASLRASQYYAHPQNLFWRILGEILGAQDKSLRDAPYADKLRLLATNGIALWDVLASCVREGSLDADIDPGSMQPNDFTTFFATHARIERVLFNGAKAEACFRKHVAPSLDARTVRLRKVAEWRTALMPMDDPAKVFKPT
jgi:TDG/mug DNA glycosylase family protein